MCVRSMYGIDVPLGTGNLQLVPGGVVLARLQGKHFHLLLEGQLLRHGFGLLFLLLFRQPTRPGITIDFLGTDDAWSDLNLHVPTFRFWSCRGVQHSRHGFVDEAIGIRSLHDRPQLALLATASDQVSRLGIAATHGPIVGYAEYSNVSVVVVHCICCSRIIIVERNPSVISVGSRPESRVVEIRIVVAVVADTVATGRRGEVVCGIRWTASGSGREEIVPVPSQSVVVAAVAIVVEEILLLLLMLICVRDYIAIEGKLGGTAAYFLLLHDHVGTVPFRWRRWWGNGGVVILRGG